MDASDKLAQLVAQLTGDDPEEVTLPLRASENGAHGELLDHATSLLEPRGYHLRSVRIDDGTWFATYVRRRPPAR